MFEDLAEFKKKELLEFQLLFHENELKTKKFFNTLFFKIFLDFLDDRPTYIPNVGTFKFKYVKDKLVKVNGVDKKKAVLDVEFEADKKFAKNAGQNADGETTEIEKFLKNKIKMKLDFQLNTKDLDL